MKNNCKVVFLHVFLKITWICYRTNTLFYIISESLFKSFVKKLLIYSTFILQHHFYK